eukprot:s599_g10.t1
MSWRTREYALILFRATERFFRALRCQLGDAGSAGFCLQNWAEIENFLAQRAFKGAFAERFVLVAEQDAAKYTLCSQRLKEPGEECMDTVWL